MQVSFRLLIKGKLLNAGTLGKILCKFEVIKGQTCMITRVQTIGDANAHDQIVFYALHSFLLEVQWIAGASYMLPAKILL